MLLTCSFCLIYGLSQYSPLLFPAPQNATTRVVVAGNTPAGTFYGANTLSELIDQHYGGKPPGCVIKDWPDMVERDCSLMGLRSV